MAANIVVVVHVNGPALSRPPPQILGISFEIFRRVASRITPCCRAMPSHVDEGSIVGLISRGSTRHVVDTQRSLVLIEQAVHLFV